MLYSVRHALLNWRLQKKWQGKTLEHLAWLEERQFSPQGEVDRHQQSRLVNLLNHAATNVPYYRRVLHDIGLFDQKGRVLLSRFQRIPLLGKPTLVKRFDELKSSDLDSRSWYYNTSGGSTGEPVRLIQDEAYLEWATSTKIFFDRWTGYKYGEPKVVLWGSERDLYGKDIALKVRLGRLIRNETWFNSMTMATQDILSYRDHINRVRPVQILAYVDAIYEMARVIEEHGLKVHAPRAIMTSAGTLQPEMRSTIERVFQAPVFNRYGSREVGDMACECEKGLGLHVNPFTHLVEVIGPNGQPLPKGEVGEVVVTSLTNYSMPLIRYRIGDLAAWSTVDCECGRPFPLLSHVHGRTNSIIRTPSRTIAGGITSLFYYKDDSDTEVFQSFSRYQVVQRAIDQIEVLILVRNKALWEEEREILKYKLPLVFGPDVDIQIHTVEAIPPAPSGKYSYVISEVEPALD